MQVEVTAAINLIAGSLYNKLPRRRVDAFAEEVEKGITLKFQGHWYPGNPSKGAAYRCINVSGEKVDPLFVYAAINSGLEMDEVINYLPKDLIIWIDPGEVSFSIGEKGQVRILYSERRAAQASSTAAALTHAAAEESSVSTAAPISFPGGFQSTASSASSGVMSPLSSPDELTSNLSSSLGSLSLSSGGSGTNGCTSTSWGTTPSPISWSSANTNNPWSPMSPPKSSPFQSWGMEPTNFNSAPNVIPQQLLQQPQQSAFQIGGPPSLSAPRPNNTNNKTMTAAMFAQTKFGSTKLKNHMKRSNRLSPTENASRLLAGCSSYASGSGRHNHTMSPAFFDRLQNHMNNQQHDFPIDHFRMGGGNSMRTRGSVDRFPMPPTNNFNSSNSSLGRYSPCTTNSSLAAMFSSSDQDWVDLSDIVLPSSGNQLLAA